LHRRALLRGALGAIPLTFLWRRTARAAGRFGALVPDPDGILDLPDGFTYRIVERAGAAMDDGYRVPGRPDGMACFPGAAGTLVLMRNHELVATDTAISPYFPGQSPPPEAYRALQLGGVSRVVVDAATGERVSSNLVLAGTARNCDGGTSPWGWLSCEESLVADHGWVFLCRADADRVQAPERIDRYGRMNHEAAVVDPDTRIAYLTEDDAVSCLYRFVPAAPETPFEGTLQALRVVGADNLDTSTGHPTGASWEIAWVDVADPTAATTTTRAQGQAQGAAVVRRGEGLWFDGGSVFFASTSGGPGNRGQIFRLDPDGDGGTLTLLAQSDDGQVLESPDNLTVAPWGDLFIVEDGAGEDLIRILHPDGTFSDFARNAISASELAGVCFSPDGSILFVNIQADGYTLAITGPFPPPPRRLEEGGGCAATPDPTGALVVTAAAIAVASSTRRRA
jgi:uncharacterized repeat protein (TIGR03803 family)